MGYEGGWSAWRTGSTWRRSCSCRLVWTIRGSGADFHSGRLKARRTRSWHDETQGGGLGDCRRARLPDGRTGRARRRTHRTHAPDLRERPPPAAPPARHYDTTAKAADGVIVRAGASPRAARPFRPSWSSRSALAARPSPVASRCRTGPSTALSGRVTGDLVQAKLAHVKAGDGEPVSDLADPRPDRAQVETDARANARALTKRTATLEPTMPGDPTASATFARLWVPTGSLARLDPTLASVGYNCRSRLTLHSDAIYGALHVFNASPSVTVHRGLSRLARARFPSTRARHAPRGGQWGGQDHRT